VLAVVLHSDTLNNEEGLRLLEDGGDIELPLEDDAEGNEDEYLNAQDPTFPARSAEGGRGDSELGQCISPRVILPLPRALTECSLIVNGHINSSIPLGKRNDPEEEPPLFTVGDAEEQG